MPFQLPERPATLIFEDGPLQGLEVEVRLAVPFDFYFELSAFMAPEERNGKHKLSIEQQVAKAQASLNGTRTFMRRFAEMAVIGWNLVDRDGRPVPATPDAFTSHLDPLSFGALLGRYQAAIGGKPGPLRLPSASGRTSKARPASRNRRS